MELARVSQGVLVPCYSFVELAIPQGPVGHIQRGFGRSAVLGPLVE